LSFEPRTCRPPTLIGRKREGVVTLDSDALPQIVAAVEKIRTA
jgi:hypothetical protein